MIKIPEEKEYYWDETGELHAKDEGMMFLQDPSEIKMFLQLITNSANTIRTVIDIGTADGGTAFLWAQLVAPRDGIVITVDSTQHEHHWYDGTEFEKYIIPIIGKSGDEETFQQVLDILNERSNGLSDFVFIDGNHDVMLCLCDFFLYGRTATKLIAFHDIQPTTRMYNGPSVVWSYIKRWYLLTSEIVNVERRDCSFTRNGWTPGIGICYNVKV